ncbi:MAG TPA: GNAT family N-acetyltransferase [Candidatus Limnocylindrales bacterium]|nr:GNAT family N-acetyltransferase [Candidatus Limnocylindrales bacterium]
MADEDAPEKLKREKAGTYRTADGRFTVEQSSSGWLLLDAEQANELGLPLTRGPFATLDEAREALAAARTGPPPKGEIVSIAGRPRRTDRAGEEDAAASKRRADADERTQRPTPAPKPKPATKRPAKPAVTIREFRAADGDQLRKLWATCGFRSLGDDDLSLARMARRNPGLLVVASEGTRVIASALGAWDGRRGWIYHVATAESHRRQGLAAKLVDQVEAGLRDLGCPKVSVLVRDENEDAREFWRARGYAEASRQFARELTRG